VAFLQKDSTYEVVGGYRATPWLTLERGRLLHGLPGRGAGRRAASIETLYTDETAPGLAEQPDFWRLGTWAVLDTRDVAHNPHRGALAAALWTRYDDRNGNAYRFDRFAADGRVYLPSATARGSWPSAPTTRRTTRPRGPGALLPPGLARSSKTLRGYESQRFRGERVLLFQGEYRIEAAPALEVALFADAGTVAVLRTDPLGDLRADWGVGLRLKTHEAVLVRMDAAWGDEGFKFALRFSPVF